jgi:cytochrome b561
MSSTYDTRSIVFHWLTAALVLTLWLVAQSIDFLPRGDPRMVLRSVHMTLGVLLAVVLVARVYWRFTGGIKLAPADSGWRGKLATGVHHLLYLLLFAAVLLGLFAAWARGDNYFNLFTIPAFDPENRPLRRDAVERHGNVANILLILALLHGAMAIWHHRVMKDNVLRRMQPSLPARP